MERILARDYQEPVRPKPKVEVHSIKDIIEHKPSTKLVREYFRGVAENITSAGDEEFLDEDEN